MQSISGFCFVFVKIILYVMHSCENFSTTLLKAKNNTSTKEKKL